VLESFASFVRVCMSVCALLVSVLVVGELETKDEEEKAEDDAAEEEEGEARGSICSRPAGRAR
jgi:hypothetical protein